MIRIISVLAILCMSFPGLYNVSVFIDYQLDMDEYVQKCENRDIPMMHCDGKCLLAKKIVEANKRDQPENPSFLSETSDYLQAELVELKMEFLTNLLFWSYNDSEPIAGSTSIFHPPLMWFLLSI